jgi:hypothetical protein
MTREAFWIGKTGRGVGSGDGEREGGRDDERLGLEGQEKKRKEKKEMEKDVRQSRDGARSTEP